MKFRNKLISYASLLVVLAMFSALVLVLVTLQSQNKKVAQQALAKSFEITLHEIADIQQKTLAEARQIIPAAELGSNLKFIEEFGDNAQVVSDAFDSTLRQLYRVAVANQIWQLEVYDSQQNVKAFVRLDDQSVTMGYPWSENDKNVFKVANLNTGEQPTIDHWKIMDAMPISKSFASEKAPEKELTLFSENNANLCIASYVPVIVEVYGSDSDGAEQKTVGFVAVIHKIDQAVAAKLQKFTGTEINVFTPKGMSAGTFKDYNSIDLNSITASEDKAQIADHQIYFKNLKVESDEFAVGMMPISNQNDVIGAIISLYSLDGAKANVWYMIKLLSIVGLICTLGAIGVTIFFANSMTKPFNQCIKALKANSKEVSTDSTYLLSANRVVAEGSAQQAASIEETSSSLEQMSSMTKQNADNASEADSLMSGTEEVFEQAKKAMNGLTNSMSDISKTSEETFKIIKTIDEIAFQTNLLALNAAVEAARAGEAGAGFAVVADEVRNLALRAAEAAKDTKRLIEGTVEKISEGEGQVTRTSGAFTQISENVTKVGQLVHDIATASNEQADGIEHVNKAVSDMDEVVQQNAANAEQSSAASEDMRERADQMQASVEKLVRLIEGRRKKDGDPVSEPKPSKESRNTSGRIQNGKSHSLPVAAVPEAVIEDEDDDFRNF